MKNLFFSLKFSKFLGFGLSNMFSASERRDVILPIDPVSSGRGGGFDWEGSTEDFS